MGCDIHGWIEYNKYGRWRPLVNIEMFFDRDYDLFGLLFGVRNYGNFKPVAEDRGLPEDISDVVKSEHDKWGLDAHSESWIGWEEIGSINKDMVSEEADSRIHEYIMENGKWKFLSKATYSANVAQALQEMTKAETKIWEKEGILIKGEWKYALEKLSAGEVLNSYGIEKAQKFIDLAKECLGNKNNELKFRLVVWFDN